MPNCPVCGTDVPDTARFCRDCGHTVSAPTAIDEATDMKNPPPADAQPMDIPTLPARSFANDNEKEQDRAGLPSVSASSSPASAALPAQTPGTPAAKGERSSAAKWLIIGIIALVLIAGGVGGLLIFLPPYAPHAPRPRG